MQWFTAVDWNSVFIPDTPLLEIFVRGSVIYLSLFIMLRLILKRQAGAVGISDLLVIVLIADAAQNAMAGGYQSLPDGIALVATLIFWNFTLEWLGFHFPKFERLISPPPLPLVENGDILRRNMRKELITEDELLTQMRLQGIENLNKVKKACMESDGKISFIEHGAHKTRNVTPDRSPAL